MNVGCEYYARSWAKPGSIYILVVRQRTRTCHAGCAAHPYFLTCLGLVRQRSGSIGASYNSKGIPPLQYDSDCRSRLLEFKRNMNIMSIKSDNLTSNIMLKIKFTLTFIILQLKNQANH